MPDDPDTDVVKIIVGKDRYIPLIVSQSTTQVTAGLAVERFPAALRRIADGILISCDEMIEWSIERNERALASGNSGEHVMLVHVPTKGLDELLLVVRVAGDLGDPRRGCWPSPFRRIRDRARRRRVAGRIRPELWTAALPISVLFDRGRRALAGGGATSDLWGRLRKTPMAPARTAPASTIHSAFPAREAANSILTGSVGGAGAASDL